MTDALVHEGKALVLSSARVVEVTCQAQYQLAVQLGRDIHAHLQDCEARRKQQIARSQDYIDSVNLRWKKRTEQLRAIEAKLKALVLPWEKTERDRVAAERQAISEEYHRLEELRVEAVKAGNSDEAKKLGEQSYAVITQSVRPEKADGSRFREEVDFEIVDLYAAVRAHPELFKIEPRRSLIKAFPVDAQLPGIRLFTKASVNFVRA